MALAPGGQNADLSKAIHVAEDAFFLMEFCIVRRMPSYKNYGHWGLTRVPSSVWEDVLIAVGELEERLAGARGPADISFEGMNASTLLAAFNANFQLTRTAALGLLREISQLTGCWARDHEAVFVLGI